MSLIRARTPSQRRRRFGLITVAAGAALVAGMLSGPAAAAAARAHAPAASPGKAVPVTAVARHAVAIPKTTPAARPAAVWPAGGASIIDVSAAGGGPVTPVKAGGLALTLGPATGSSASRSAEAGVATTAISQARATVSSQATATALGVHGVVFSLARADGGADSGQVDLGVGYAGFANADGGNYGSRLELVALPVCSMTTPQVAKCRIETPLGSHNDTRTQTVDANVTLPGTAANAAAKPAVLAIVAGPSGSAGNFAAEPSSEETDDWVGGADGGDYQYSYPIAAPPVPGGLEPNVSLNYDSESTMGLNASTNDEASWIGDGFDYDAGYIEYDYPTCASSPLDPQTGDPCGGTVEITLSLNGTSTPLVYGANGWRAAADGGAQITETNNTWQVTEPDGTRYYFGMNDLPGYTSGDAPMNAQWTVPVFGGCGEAAFCTLPWRDMLSYEVDSHSDAIAYSYTTQTNSYAEQNGTVANGTYTRGGALSTISYGFRAGQYYTSTPAAKVDFTVATTRQDAPADLACTAGAACSITSPTYWSTYQLTGISTTALVNGAMQPVDSWALSGVYPATGDTTTSSSLWLSSITRTGQDGTTPITLPPVSFTPAAKANRDMTAADIVAGYSAITRFYLQTVTNETGGVTGIAYTNPYTGAPPPSPSTNTTSLYPDFWTPQGATTQVEDWFQTYAVSSVTTTDTTGDDPPQVTSYTYAGPAWRYNGDTVSRSATVTYDQWSGYQTVTTQTGTAPDQVTETVDSYLQGRSQTGPPDNPGPVVTFTTSRGQSLTDSNQFAGMLAESITYDGAGSGQEVTDTVYAPWSSSATAVNTALDQAAYMTGNSNTETYTALAGGGVRESIESYTYNSYGLEATDSDVPDIANTAESTCTSTIYAANTATWLLSLPETVATVTGACGSEASGSGQLVSETEYLYDGGNLGSPASAGNVTKTETAVSGGGLVPTFTTSTAAYDQYGRVLTSTDADTHTTATAYTPAAGAEPASVKITDPMSLVTTTTYDPTRDLPLTVTDPTGGQTATTYDALGRKTAVWNPGNPVSGPADATYGYTVSDTAPSAISEQTEEPNGGYLASETIYDSLEQPRETQRETADGGSDVTDTTYNSDGWKTLVSNPYYIAAAPSVTLVAAASSAVPSQVEYAYDGDGRVTREISYSYGKETWETDTSYGGDYTTVVPPQGGTPTTTLTDGRGLTTAIYQYHAGVAASPADPASDYDQTSYTYTPAQDLAAITDTEGNAWNYTYNLLGSILTSADPDAGTTTNTYDADQQLLTSTDGRGKQTSYTYDTDGRKTAEYDTTGGAAETSANEVATWLYDTLAKGKLTSSTSFQGGAAYTEQYTGYNAYEQPEGDETIIPSSQGALAGTYTQSYTYAATGQETSYTDQAAGDLPAETVTTGYDNAGEPDSLTGATAYAADLTYTELGQPLQYQEGTDSDPVYVTDSYDPETARLTEQNAQIGAADTSIDDLHYTYNDVGDVTSEADAPSGDTAATDVECFQYDYLGRLVQAWAQGADSCISTPSASVEGGAAAYWNTYSYNTIGDLTSETSTLPSGAATTTAYTYPAPDSARPHAVTGSAATTPAGTTNTAYGYDTSGDLTSVSTAAQSDALTWNDQGRLTGDSVTPAGGSAQNTAFTYDADGNLLIRTDPGTVTLLLGDEELVLDLGSGSVAGTRFYSIGGEQVASRNGSDVSYLIGDQQGTSSVAVDAATLGVTRRYFDPYGSPIGTAPTDWPGGQKGFVGGTTDAGTSLTDLGAREYQPGTGSFISPDPLLNAYDPQDLNAYAYAADNPATLEDPTGAAPSPATCRLLPPKDAEDAGCAGHPSAPKAGKKAAPAPSPKPSPETCRHLDPEDAGAAGCYGVPRAPKNDDNPPAASHARSSDTHRVLAQPDPGFKRTPSKSASPKSPLCSSPAANAWCAAALTGVSAGVCAMLEIECGPLTAAGLCVTGYYAGGNGSARGAALIGSACAAGYFAAKGATKFVKSIMRDPQNESCDGNCWDHVEQVYPVPPTGSGEDVAPEPGAPGGAAGAMDGEGGGGHDLTQ